MAVLVCLAEKPGEVITRQQLEETVWPRMVIGYDALSNTIAKLRKAFGDDRNNPQIIETIPKVGYRLIARISPSSQHGDTHQAKPLQGKPLQGKLAAILYAHVAGYTRLTRSDDDATRHRLPESLDLISAAIERHDGRVVQHEGNAVLADFATISNALGCASAVQEELRAHNETLPAEHRLMYRMGLNIGEVIEDLGKMYGDGVNVAARLGALAEPGGICISESVRTAIGKLLPLHYEFLGEQPVKNIDSQVRAYAVRSKEEAAGAASSPAVESKPRVAVLPFDNMSGVRDDEYLADGITEDVITALSKDRGLSVIARNSTFAFKGRSIDVRRMGKELGAGYVVEGSVRRAGNRVRISAQLLDAASGNHIWAERYDRDLDDIFALQDEITGTIAARIEPELEMVERQRAQRKPTRNLGAWDCYHLGMAHVYTFTKEGNTQAQKLFRRAIELDDQFAQAHARLAYCMVLEMVYYEAEPSQTVLDEALRLVQRAVFLDDQEAFCHLAVARVRLARREYALALIACEAALKLNPHSAVAYCVFANGLAYSGRLEDSLGALEEAIRLSPNDPWRPAFFSYGSMAHLLLGHFETAAEWARSAISLPNCQHWAHAHLAAALGQLGKVDEANAALAELLQMKPEFSCSYARQHLFYLESDEQVEQYVDALRHAGLRE
ncbi:MAG: tetratricopeptide repeat protein [Gammaproteobacteria bacterium]|nr:tetratricopeptide repeat protein [Gammaproteobacteria bacterium]